MQVMITNSWGDEKQHIDIPEGQIPWEYMKHLVVDEAETAFREHEYSGPIELEFWYNELEKEIIIQYPWDNENCTYQLV